MVILNNGATKKLINLSFLHHIFAIHCHLLDLTVASNLSHSDDHMSTLINLLPFYGLVSMLIRRHSGQIDGTWWTVPGGYY